MNNTTDRGTTQVLTRRRFLALFAASAGAAAVACAPSAPPASPAAEKAAPAVAKPTTAPAKAAAAPSGTGQIVAGLQGAGLSLDPAKTTAIEDWAKVQQLYNGLLRYKPGGFELEPDLAESWDVSNDGKKYTFKLKKGIEFHKDFGEFTAEDVKFSIERQLDENFKSFNRAHLWMIDRVDAVDKHTVRFTLKQPYAAFLSVVALSRPMSGAMVSKAAAEKLGNDNYTEHPIGTGPFAFDNEIPKQSVTLVGNDRYYEGAPKVASVKLLNMPDETTLGLAVEKGEVHVGNIREADLIEKYRDTPTTQVLIGERFNVAGLMLNMELKPLDDVNVRRALAHAVNGPELIEGVLGGIALIANAGLIHPKMLGHDPSIKPWTFDPNKAKQMLSQAAIKDPSTQAVTYTGSDWTTVGALLQQQFAQAGVSFKVNQLERGALTKRRAAPDNPITIISFTTGPDPDTLMSYFESAQIPPGGLNLARYKGADELIQQTRLEPDQEKRARIISKVQSKFAEDVPMIPIYHTKMTVLVSKKVQGYQVDPLGGHWLHFVALA